MRAAVLCASVLALAGCGGSVFAPGDRADVLDPDGGAALDAQNESAAEDAGRGGSHDANGGETQGEAAAVDAPPAGDCCSNPTMACKGGCADAAPVDACTPLPPATGQRPYACAFSDAGHTAPVPAMFAWQSATACGYAPTPAECQCSNSYDCACLKAAGVCSTVTGTAWVACDDQATNMPIVTCD